MNLIRKLMGNSATDEISGIAKGKFFLTRSKNSPKGSLECLYNDAFISINQTTRPFYYELTIGKVYQEGEINDSNENEFGESDDELEGNDNLTNQLKDEWNFIILQDLKFQVVDKDDGSKAVCWIDLNGDVGDKFEFVMDDDISLRELKHFKDNLFKCVYELKYHKVPQSLAELKEFETVEEELSMDDFQKDLLKYNKLIGSVKLDPVEDDESELDEEKKAKPFEFIEDVTSEVKPIYADQADIYVHDGNSMNFIAPADILIIDLSNFNYAVRVKAKNLLFDTVIGDSMNSYLDQDRRCLIYNHTSSVNNEITSLTWLASFIDEKSFSNFKSKFVESFWESANKTKFGSEKNKLNEEYLIDAMSNMQLSDDDDFLTADDRESDEEDDRESDDEEEDKDSDEEPEQQKKTIRKSRIKVSSESAGQSAYNSGLSVGYANDRSYVVRGNNLGVFKNANKKLEFQTTIGNLTNKKGEKLTPFKLMLQNRDENLVFKGEDDSKLYRMDLNRGTIVDEWDIKEQNGISNFNPNKKMDQFTIEQTFSGISNNALFKLDPRVANVVVQEGKKEYKTNNKFNNLATTDAGHLAVSSGSGEIRLYDRIGVNAKTLLPSLGDSISNVDVSKDGRWLLATCSNYLLLLDLKIGKGQRNEGHLGFTKSFNADSKPVPRRLMLKPEHSAFILNDMGQKNLDFSGARFNTSEGESQETSIVTSTGKYVVIFNIKNVLKNKEPKYKVRKFGDLVINSDFQFSSNNVILATANDVAVASGRGFKQLGQ